MKKTRMLVVTAAIILGIGTSVQAKLPANSIMVGSNVYSSGYLSDPNNLTKVNDQLMNNLGLIYFVDNSGKAKDVFTGSIVTDSELVGKVGNALTYYNDAGVMQKIVADANNEYEDPRTVNSDKFAILNIRYKPLTATLTMYYVKITQISGVSNASYFKIGDSAVTSLTDTATYIGGPTSGGSPITIYAGDGIIPIASSYVSIKYDSNVGGEQNVSVILDSASSENPIDKTTHGNTAVNIANNGFAAIDKDGKWIYYQNTGDKKKLYKKSVTGVEDYVISDDSVGFINVIGDWVYYSNYDDKGKIYKVRTDGTQRQIVSDDMASCVNVVGDKIYYINNSDRGRIYIIDSQGRRQLIPASAKFLSVGDNYLFYVNTSDGNKLYSYDLLNNRSPQKISNVNTAFINAAGDYLIFYTGKDGKLYRSTNGIAQNAIPMPLITNIPQKGGKGSSDMKGVADTATAICAIDDNNIYYKSYVDGGKIYKLDNTGNGYKVVDAAADYMNIVGDSLYFMKSGKVYVVPKDADGSVKGTAVAKPKLNEKVVTVEPLPMFTTDDITKFSFPQRVSCIMSDGTIRQLVVNWDDSTPKPSKGVYNFKGTILGYGTKVTMSVALDSGTLDADAVEVTNEIGNKDTVKVDGLKAKGKLEPGDIISVYNEFGDLKPIKTAVVDKNGNVLISGLNFNPDGGSVYVSITKKDKAEGNRVTVAVPAEAPVGFLVDAENENITGLKPEKQYKVYINDLSNDGSIPALPDNPFVTVTSNDKGEITVKGMKTEIEDNKPDNKQMLRLVAVGVKDSMPSAPIEISKAKVPDYVSIDLNLGRIVGTSAQMQYKYKDTEEWKDCQPGTTPISMTMSLQVQVQVKASGPVMASDVKKFGLFPMPVVTGIENGKIYAGKDSKGNAIFPDVSWNSDTDNITYTATLVKDGGSPEVVTIGDLKEKVKENGDYVLTVTGTKTDDNMDPSTATNVTVINFTVNSSAPSQTDITMAEKAGTVKDAITNPDKLDTYYQATPTWTDLAGTSSKATIKMTKIVKEGSKPGNVEYTSVNNPAEVAFVRGNTISQSGEYEFKVTTTSKENGAKSETKKIFRVDGINKAVTPDVVGVNEGGVYKDVKTGISITDKTNCKTKATIMREGYITPYEPGDKLTVNGKYVLILNTINEINGHHINKEIGFTIDDASSNVTPDAPKDITFSFSTGKFTGPKDYSMEYSINGGASWKQLNPEQALEQSEIDKITKNNGIWIRYKKTETTLESSPLKLIFTPMEVPKLTFDFSSQIISDSANCNKYQYSINGGTQWNEFNADGKLQDGDYEKLSTSNKLKVRAKASGDKCVSDPQTIDVVRLNPITTAPKVELKTGDNTGTKYTISGLNNSMQYSMDNGSTWIDVSTDVVDIDMPLDGAKITVRYKATKGAMASSPSPVKEYAAQAEAPKVTIDSADPSNVKFTQKSVTTGMEYSLDGTAWKDITADLVDGTKSIDCSGKKLYVRIKATNDVLVSKTTNDLLGGVYAPALKNGLNFADATGGTNDGKTTIKLGAPSAEGNTFVYKVSDNDNAVPMPKVGDDLTGWTPAANGDMITAANGKHIGVAEVDKNNKVVQFSDATAVTIDATAAVKTADANLGTSVAFNTATKIQINGTDVPLGNIKLLSTNFDATVPANTNKVITALQKDINEVEVLFGRFTVSSSGNKLIITSTNKGAGVVVDLTGSDTTTGATLLGFTTLGEVKGNN